MQVYRLPMKIRDTLFDEALTYIKDVAQAKCERLENKTSCINARNMQKKDWCYICSAQDYMGKIRENEEDKYFSYYPL